MGIRFVLRDFVTVEKYRSKCQSFLPVASFKSMYNSKILTRHYISRGTKYVVTLPVGNYQSVEFQFLGPTLEETYAHAMISEFENGWCGRWENLTSPLNHVVYLNQRRNQFLLFFADLTIPYTSIELTLHVNARGKNAGELNEYVLFQTDDFVSNR